jgi:hypothetical protein
MFLRHVVARATLVVTILAGYAFADDPTAPVEQPAATATSQQISEWIKQLDHDGFNVRESAQQKLEEAGEAAFEALREAALGESQEAATRAVEVLKKHYHGSNDALKNAAQTQLDKISKSDNPIAVRRAEAALQAAPKPEQKPADPAVPTVPFGGGGIRIGGGGGAFKIEVRSAVIGGGKGKSISVKNVDGNKEINVEEEGRKVKIEESAAGKIKMSVTEKVDGKEETKTYEAESADDLKKVQPEAHKIYEQYKQGGDGGRIEFKAVPVDPARIRVRPAFPRALPVPIPEGLPAADLERLKEAQKRLEETRKRLEAELPNLEPKVKDKSAALERLDGALKQLEATRAQLEKSAGEGTAEAIKQAIERLEATKKQLEEAKAELAE